MSEALNPFARPAAGSEYAAARPSGHARAVEIAARLLGLAGSLELALDVGSGTGMSSRALARLARRVVGVDPSRAMVEAAGDGKWVVGSGERLPVRSGACDLVAFANCLHWLDPEESYGEAGRVLRSGGALVVWVEWFTGQAAEMPALREWLVGEYYPEVPSPPRHAHFDGERAGEAGFEAVAEEAFEYQAPMTADAFADYLMTQSNAIEAVASGKFSHEGLRDWIAGESRARLTDGRGTVLFGGYVWTLRWAGYSAG